MQTKNKKNPTTTTIQIKLLRRNLATSGACSFGNGLEAARSALRHVPSHTHREVLLVASSLHTADPSDIGATIAGLAAERVRVSIVGLAAEVRVLTRLAEATSGSYTISMSERHLSELVKAHVQPPVTTPVEVDGAAVGAVG
jgi:transcription initiation factor TFIIH subunit 2